MEVLQTSSGLGLTDPGPFLHWSIGKIPQSMVKKVMFGGLLNLGDWCYVGLFKDSLSKAFTVKLTVLAGCKWLRRGLSAERSSSVLRANDQ